jgi:hypothetical protein
MTIEAWTYAVMENNRRERLRLSFDSSKHPRGQPKNKGEFVKKGGAEGLTSGQGREHKVICGIPDHPGATKGAEVNVIVSKERAWDGKASEIPLKNLITPQQTGCVGEAVALAYYRQVLGYKDADPINSENPSEAADMIEDEHPTEVKAGLVNITKKSQQWRLTSSKESKEEIALYDKMSAKERKLWNLDKAKRIKLRKKALIRDYNKKTGKRHTFKTITVVVNPDKQICDLFVFDGIHSRIDWQSAEAKAAYKVSLKYDHAK